MNSIDRLSGLPDDVICHILSFLPTKGSVATSILARRWRFLWAHVPILDFSSNHNRTGTDISNIINEVMLRHKGQSINTFRLYHIDVCSDYEFEKWIATVIARNVRNLDIYLDYLLMLPQRLFTCKTLVDLRLHYCCDIPMTGTVYLPALKKLHLDMVMYESDESLPHLLSGCPVLEELIIERENALNMVVCCYISSPTLNRLELSSEFHEFEDEACEVKLDTPELRYLRLYHIVPGNVSARALTSLTEADVNFNAPIERDVLYSRSVLEFVGRLYNVKCLRLSTGWMEVPDSAFSGLTMKFHNLTKLVLDEADWRFISNFLENADNLEVLAIICIVEECPKYWVDPKQVPTCLLSHLETVSIDQFECTEQEFNMVRYFLRNAKVLKRMEIYSRNHRFDLKEKFEELKKISLFERRSDVRQLALHSDL